MADKIVSRPATDKYREEYDRIFRKKNKPLYGIRQYVGDSGPAPVASDLIKPVAEDGSDPSSK